MQHRLHKLSTLVLLVMMVGIPLASVRAVQAQPGPICFNESPYCIPPGPIQDYWVNNGGLPVFGLPISQQQVETIPDPAGDWTGMVQWFERDRLEDHTPEGVGVLAGLLGNRFLEMRGTSWHTYPKTSRAATPAGCRYFEETQHSLCEPFLSYWQRYGGLERFGFPVTQPVEETISTGQNESWTGTVQYFQRRRMEHHTENAGTEYEVLLGLLGKTLQNSCPEGLLPELCSAYLRMEEFIRRDMQQPATAYEDILAAFQNFENGVMIWTQLVPGEDERVYVLFSYGGYRMYNDTYDPDNDPEVPNVKCPNPDLYTPRRGFGKVWSNFPEVRTSIGCATEPIERGVTATVQLFQGGGVMVWIKDSDAVYIFGPNEWQTQNLSRR
jgi:hypothetical protein